MIKQIYDYKESDLYMFEFITYREIIKKYAEINISDEELDIIENNDQVITKTLYSYKPYEFKKLRKINNTINLNDLLELTNKKYNEVCDILLYIERLFDAIETIYEDIEIKLKG